MSTQTTTDLAARFEAKREKIRVDYTNYRGERGIRTITPWGVEWGSTEHHQEPQWLLTCYDHDKHACRVYALRDIHAWNGVPTENPTAIARDMARAGAAGGAGAGLGFDAARAEYARWATGGDTSRRASERNWACRQNDNGTWAITTYHERYDEADQARHEQALAAAIQAAAPPPPAQQGSLSPEIAAKQLTLGLGLVDITIIRHEGKAGVLFSPRAEHIEFGAGGKIEAGEYWPTADDVVLWVDGEGPGVVISYLLQLAQGSSSPPLTAEQLGLAELERALKTIRDGLEACEEMCRLLDGDMPDNATVEVRGARRSSFDLFTYGDLRALVLAAGHLVPASLPGGTGSAEEGTGENTADEQANAIKECAEAVAFFDQVKRSTPAEQAAVGTDHWNWLEKASRRVAALATLHASQDQGGEVR